MLVHLLPGLAVFAQRHFTPASLRGWRGLLALVRQLPSRGLQLPASHPPVQQPTHLAAWLVAAPLGFYLGWQLLYFLVVQVRGSGQWAPGAGRGGALGSLQVPLCLPDPPAPTPPQVAFRPLIQSRGLDTSYNCLARRAARTNNIWNRLIRRGSVARRCAMYGALQLAFTCVALAVFLPTYFCYPLALIMQVGGCVGGGWRAGRLAGGRAGGRVGGRVG